MNDWKFVQRDTSEQLAHIQHFAMTKRDGDLETEFLITVREYVTPKDPAMRFFAQADKQVNQSAAAYTPCGWGGSLSEALSECMQQIRRFPYQDGTQATRQQPPCG
jgi:hypothetical protein